MKRLAAFLLFQIFVFCNNSFIFGIEKLDVTIDIEIPIKILGQKIEFTDEEKLKISKYLDNKYEIISQIGVSGWHTSAYLMENELGEKFVIKFPNNLKDKDWVKLQSNTYLKIDECFHEYKGDVELPKCIYLGNNFTIEKYLGEEFNEEKFEELSENEKLKIINDFAEFLNFMCKKSVNKDYKVTYSRLFTYYPTIFNLMDCFEYLKAVLSDKQQEELLEEINEFNSRSKEDEIECLVHCDIKSQNVLYNKDSKKISVIDLELLSLGNIYYNFVPHAAAQFEISYKFLYNVVDLYNKISDRKINLQKLRLFHKLGIIYEICAYNKIRYKKTSYEEVYTIWNNSILPKINKIDEFFV